MSNEIFMLEFFIDQLLLPKNLVTNYDQIEVQILCNEKLRFNIFPTLNKEKFDLNKTYKGGKSVLFTSSREQVLETFKTDFMVIINKTVEELGIAVITWSETFEAELNEIVMGTQIRRNDKFDINNSTNEKIGIISVNMGLYYYGKIIEILLSSNITSTVTLPVLQGGQKKDDYSDGWQSLFSTPHKKRQSIVDAGLKLYAQMAGLDLDAEEEKRRLTSEYIQSHICGHKHCPGAFMFRDYGLGPLAPPGSGLGTIDSIQASRPCGLYGLSQTYGTLSHYGAYGLLIEPPKHRKKTCGSEACPYIEFLKDSSAESAESGVEEDQPSCSNIKYIYSPCTCGKNGQCPILKKEKFLCQGPICPKDPKEPRQKAGADKPENFPNNPSPRPCSWRTETIYTLEDKTSSESDWGKPKNKCSPLCRGYNTHRPSSSIIQNQKRESGIIIREVEKNNCGDKQCLSNLNTDDKTKYYTTEAVPNVDGKKKRFSLLVNDEGKKVLVGDKKPSRGRSFQSAQDLLTQLSSKEYLATMSIGEDSELYYFIARLLAQREKTFSMNNFLADAFTTRDNTSESTPKHPSGPCVKPSCKDFKYITCSECGGVSRSGATCDNTNVSFTTLSYSDYGEYEIPPPTQKQEPQNDDVATTEPPPASAPAALEEENKKPVEGGENSNTKETQVAKKTRKRRSRFVYTAGEEYPGIRQGHRTCRTLQKNVPANMGWLWNVKLEGQRKKRKGWRPGALTKVINDKIVAHRRARGIPDPPALKMLNINRKFTSPATEKSDSDSDWEVEQKPTLTIQKQNGNYLITMHPLKDPKTVADNEDPYMACKPLQFIITKPKKPPISTVTTPNVYKSHSKNTVNDNQSEADSNYYDNYYKTCCCDEDDAAFLSDSSNSGSELNIEFTTPAGIIIPEKMIRHPNVVHVSTQFREEDFNCADCTIVISKYRANARKRMKAKR